MSPFTSNDYVLIIPTEGFFRGKSLETRFGQECEMVLNDLLLQSTFPYTKICTNVFTQLSKNLDEISCFDSCINHLGIMLANQDDTDDWRHVTYVDLTLLDSSVKTRLSQFKVGTTSFLSKVFFLQKSKVVFKKKVEDGVHFLSIKTLRISQHHYTLSLKTH